MRLDEPKPLPLLLGVGCYECISIRNRGSQRRTSGDLSDVA
jgi:hypothetical protein